MNNQWNKFIYKLWSPFYDKIFNSSIFLTTRKKIFKDLSFSNHEKVLFVGVGTGVDLELINHTNLNITAIDISPDMLEKAKQKFGNKYITFLEMDAQQLSFEDGTFDYVIASLVLSVVPNPKICLNEILRVVKNNGEIIIFDKFSRRNTMFKKIVRPLIRLLGTDIGINFEELALANSHPLNIIEDQDVMFQGMYRKIIVSK
ncbi:class I SAM-dependent methyltransferase [Anaerobacillus alkaliphilus]|uniref:Class I SAM-dependent methyltransferase n=1 Tax=Anaerobacillus alkaliphilus TaxID=1548597 RepID=A0A4Q0VUB4_9BACI|nr:class I SAM-dependent methyltransferase [Anaerobacillus alkaliphilus]RXJ02101.1 class I SAM-dependent methyltransferase [Anaerobacillus alkaliphilus]